MIPKVIHYCWFGGGPLPELAQKCIASWKKYCPDYEIQEWNESNFDLDNCDYFREAYQAKKWAFVSDIARLDIIYKYGGIYLDTDVELIRPLDELLVLPSFWGTETTGLVATGLGFGAEKGNQLVERMRRVYDGIHFILSDGAFDTTACPIRNTKPLEDDGYNLSENYVWRTEEAVVFPPEYFCPIDYRTGVMKISDKTYTIHHYSASWYTKENRYESCLKKSIARYFRFIPYQYICLLARFITILKFEGLGVVIKKVQDRAKIRR